MQEFASEGNSPCGRGHKWLRPQMERFVSIMVGGTWNTCVYALVVSEGRRKDHGVGGEKGQWTR
jgi:hypothetical protein